MSTPRPPLPVFSADALIAQLRAPLDVTLRPRLAIVRVEDQLGGVTEREGAGLLTRGPSEGGAGSIPAPSASDQNREGKRGVAPTRGSAPGVPLRADERNPRVIHEDRRAPQSRKPAEFLSLSHSWYIHRYGPNASVDRGQP